MAERAPPAAAGRLERERPLWEPAHRLLVSEPARSGLDEERAAPESVRTLRSPGEGASSAETSCAWPHYASTRVPIVVATAEV